MNKIKFSPVFWVCLLVGVICSAIMLTGRIKAELSSNKVAFATTYETVGTLATEEGTDEFFQMKKLYDAGVRFFIVDDENEAKYLKDAHSLGYKIARMGNTAKQGDAFIVPKLEPDNVIENNDYYGDFSVPVAVIENAFRTDVFMPDDFDVENSEFPLVKTLYMFNAYSYHFEYKHPSSENENILFRAITDRGMRLVVLTPLVDEQKEIVTDFSGYSDIISGLKQRLLDRGIYLGDEFSTLEVPKFNPLLFAGALLILVCAVVFAISLFVNISKKIEIALILCGIAVAFAGSFAFSELIQKICALAIAVLFACFSVLIFYAISRKEIMIFNHRILAVRYIVALSLVVCLGLTGGLYIASILASAPYMFGFSVFSGVKISQLLPIAFCGCALLYMLFGKKARQSRKEQKKIPVALLVFAGVAVLFALVVLILRSGDNMLPVSDIEVSFRNWLEYTLYARPRTKEMLVAFPALALFVAASYKEYPVFELPLGVLACVGVTSVINTFCHIFTPVHVSVIRTFIGAVIGFVIGLVAMYVFSFFLGKKEK